MMICSKHVFVNHESHTNLKKKKNTWKKHNQEIDLVNLIYQDVVNSGTSADVPEGYLPSTIILMEKWKLACTQLR